MDADHHEIEMKRLLRGGDATEKLLAALGGRVAAEKHQTNHLFDTAGRELLAAGYTVRLREEASGERYLTVKGPGRSVGAHTGSKAEAEAALEPELSRRILAGLLDPVEALRGKLGASEQQVLFAGLESVREARPLELQGKFENVRRVVPATLPSGLRLKVELDRTLFPDGHVDHEVEIEVPSDEHVLEVEQWLGSLLDAAGVEHSTSSPKLVRFYAHRHGSP